MLDNLQGNAKNICVAVLYQSDKVTRFFVVCYGVHCRVTAASKLEPVFMRRSRFARLCRVLVMCIAGLQAQAIFAAEKSIDLLSGNGAEAEFKAVFVEAPTELTLLINHPANPRALLNLTRYSPFSASRKVWVDGKALPAEQYGVDHMYYRGKIVGSPDSYAFITVKEQGSQVELLVGYGANIVKGIWQGKGVNWRSPPDSEALERAKKIPAPSYPDYEVPPTRKPPPNAKPAQSKQRGLPLDEADGAVLNAPSTTITIDPNKGWHGPYALEVPSGATYVGAMSRGPASAEVYVSTDSNPASVWEQLTYCEGDKCFIADPDARTYYLSVYLYDEGGNTTVDFGYGTPLASDDLYLTTVAVEIDKGLYSQFGSATAANNYIAQLFAYNSVVYEREIKTRLKVGDIFLLTAESNPYTDTDSTAIRLREVRDYWRANRTETDRSLVAHLSSAFGGGRAYTDVLCSHRWGYSVSGVDGEAPTDQVKINWDGKVNAHEIGHNFGSRHTHCYAGIEGNSSPIDACYVDTSDTEQCFQGTTSLPGAATLTGGSIGGRNGTIMSYCHQFEPESGEWGGGNTNIANTFGMNHPYGIEPDRVSTLMARKAAQLAAVSTQCLPKLSESNYTYITITVSATAGTGGTISPGSVNVVSGSTTTFTVTPDTGYAIGSVTGCGGSLNESVYTTGAITSACTVTASFSPSMPALASGVPVSDLSGSAGGTRDYYVDVPAATSSLRVALNVVDGDPDLYVDTTFPPRTNGDGACSSWQDAGIDELCELTDPAAGRYYIRIEAFKDYSGATLTATLVASSASATAFVERLYTNILGRPSDPDGLAAWLNVINTQSAAAVAQGFLNSAEFLNKNLDDSAFVDILYRTLFDREGDAGGVAVWMDQLTAGKLREMVIWGFLRSAEFKNLADSFGVTALNAADESAYGIRAFVERFYTLVLGRQPDKGGFYNWVSALTNGSYAGGDIAKAFFLSPEYLNQNTSDDDFVNTCYRAFFGREPDAGGKQGWMTALGQGKSRELVLDGFIDSAEFEALAASYGIKASSNTLKPETRSDTTVEGTDNATREVSADARSAVVEPIPVLPLMSFLTLSGLMTLLVRSRLKAAR